MGRTLGVVVAHPDDDAYGVAAIVPCAAMIRSSGSSSCVLHDIVEDL